jgi:hypothetical protein
MIRFRTTYIDPISGEEVMDFQMIASKYMFSLTFIIDVLSTAPLDDLAAIFSGDQNKNTMLSLFGILKLIRILRISSVIMNLNLSQELKALLKILNLMFNMIIYIHLMACIWYYFVSIHEEWIPNMDFIWFGTP